MKTVVGLKVSTHLRAANVWWTKNLNNTCLYIGSTVSMLLSATPQNGTCSKRHQCMLYGWAQHPSTQVQGDPKRPAEVRRWAPSSKANDSRSGSGDILTIAASILGCLAIFLKV